MPKGELAAQLLRFPRTLGTLLTAPARALRQIEAVEKGGFFLLVGWCLAAAVTLRFVNLADAFAGMDAGGGMRVVSVVVGELIEAVPVALAAALVIVVGAGAKRDPAVDLELGCAVAVPFMVARAVFRTAVIITEREPPHRWAQASYVVAGAWAAAVAVSALRIARGRPVLVGLAKPMMAGRAMAHYEVVVGINRSRGLILSLDPARGPRQNSLEGFAREWVPTHEVTLIIFAEMYGREAQRPGAS